MLCYAGSRLVLGMTVAHNLTYDVEDAYQIANHFISRC